MKLTYGITLEEFGSLQSFRPPAGRFGAFPLVIALSSLFLVLPGLALVLREIVSHHAFPARGTLGTVAVGGVICLVAYLFDRMWIQRERQKQEQVLLLAYDKVHCRDRRIVEATEDGLALSCDCGVVLKPWSELIGFTETPAFLMALMRSETVPIPKSAFASEGQITEFRCLILEKLHADRPFTSCPIEFVHTRRDFWKAKLLHNRRGGGWRRTAKMAATTASLGYGLALLVHAAQAGKVPSWLVPVGTGLFVLFVLKTAWPRRHYFGPLALYFSESSLHVVDQAAQSKRPWNEFTGFLENEDVCLLYLNPRLYRIIPKRALGGREAEICRLIQRAVPSFDYRIAAAAPRPAISR